MSAAAKLPSVKIQDIAVDYHKIHYLMCLDTRLILYCFCHSNVYLRRKRRKQTFIHMVYNGYIARAI